MSYLNIKCPVDDPEDPYGTFANAIRLSADGAEILVDFCVYSQADNRARVVSRVRVSKDFLPLIHQKIGNSLQIPESGAPVLFLMPPVDGIS